MCGSGLAAQAFSYKCCCCAVGWMGVVITYKFVFVISCIHVQLLLLCVMFFFFLSLPVLVCFLCAIECPAVFPLPVLLCFTSCLSCPFSHPLSSSPVSRQLIRRCVFRSLPSLHSLLVGLLIYCKSVQLFVTQLSFLLFLSSVVLLGFYYVFFVCLLVNVCYTRLRKPTGLHSLFAKLRQTANTCLPGRWNSRIWRSHEHVRKKQQHG